MRFQRKLQPNYPQLKFFLQFFPDILRSAFFKSSSDKDCFNARITLKTVKKTHYARKGRRGFWRPCGDI